MDRLYPCEVTSCVCLVSRAEESIVQYAAVCRAQSNQLKSFSCSETPQDDSGLTTPQNEPTTKLCDDVAARIEARIRQQRQGLNEQRCSIIRARVVFQGPSRDRTYSLYFPPVGSCVSAARAPAASAAAEACAPRPARREADLKPRPTVQVLEVQPHTPYTCVT